jgi:PTH1 family peptidyl-tRNA hydrolase
LRGISEGAPALAAGDAPRFMNAVSLRTAPPRPVRPAPGSEAAPKPATPEPKDTRSALQKLADRFR